MGNEGNAQWSSHPFIDFIERGTINDAIEF